ncbi:MAG TPA: hypothetical protein VII06_04790 [Chloroflexota bacterium]|jgi:hypothetical protein
MENIWAHYLDAAEEEEFVGPPWFDGWHASQSQANMHDVPHLIIVNEDVHQAPYIQTIPMPQPLENEDQLEYLVRAAKVVLDYDVDINKLREFTEDQLVLFGMGLATTRQFKEDTPEAALWLARMRDYVDQAAVFEVHI